MSIVTLTENAVLEVKRIMNDQNMDQEKIGLRIKVVGGGCSGFMTKLDLVEDYDETKDNLEVMENIRVFIDKRSAMYLQGANVDYYNDINKMGFIVNNPMATGRCGCNQSFSM